jgi:thiol-disulfide isomerase/thioredoxin
MAEPTAPVAAPAPPASWLARLEALRQRRWARWGIDLAVLAVVLTVVGLIQTRGHLASGTAPEATLHALTGEPVALSSLRGRPTAVAFWAPWCTVCKAESGNLSRLARWSGDRARVVSVAAAFDDPAQVRAYMAEQGVDYPVLLGDDGILRTFRVEAFPTVYFLDAEGRVKGSVSGYTTTAGLLWRLLW